MDANRRIEFPKSLENGQGAVPLGGHLYHIQLPRVYDNNLRELAKFFGYKSPTEFATMLLQQNISNWANSTKAALKLTAVMTRLLATY